jgi:copper chaperone CopZ
MKKIIIILCLVFGIHTNAQISKAEIVATGLTCSMCSNAINKQLKKLPEVDKVEVDLESNTFTVFLKKDNKITPRILKDCIQDAGFFVGSMEIYFQKSNSLSKSYIILNTEEGTKYKVMDKGYLFDREFKKAQKIFSKIPTYLINNDDDFHLKAI